jgi:hypothetical protein
MPDKDNGIHHTEREVVNRCYNELPNYLIEENTKSESDICAVYFSSNGIDAACRNDADYESIIIKNNRFEWRKNTIKGARKNIFVRDVFKEYYVEGINKDLNSCDKVYAFLKSEIRDMKVITVGSSSGGYAAVLFGILLKAEYIFSFTGQFNLYHMSLQSNPYRDPHHNPLLYKHLEDADYVRYYDLLTLMKDCSIPIFYLAGNHRLDYMQKQLVKSYYNVYTFDIKGDDHVFPCYVFSLADVINKPFEELKRLSEKYRGKIINKFIFSVKISGLAKSLMRLQKLKFKRIKLER